MKLPAIATDRKGNRTTRIAPVRRETAYERSHRCRTQIPTLGMYKMIKGGIGTVFTINDDLIPGDAKFVKTPTNYPI